MITDSFFQQSPEHEVCEDYACHAPDAVFVADGCSSGENTDWGSRLICKAAEHNIGLFRDPVQYIQAINMMASMQHRNFPNLSPRCLLATLLVARYLEANSVGDDIGPEVVTMCVGDGMWGGRRRDGRWKIKIVSCDANAPFYLKYLMFPEDIQSWTDFVLEVLLKQGIEKDRPQYTITTYFGKIMLPGFEYPELASIADPLKWPTKATRDEIWRESVSITEHTADLDPQNPCIIDSFPVNEYDLVFVLSDGPESFYERRVTKTSKHNEPMHVMDALRILMDCRIFRPGFLRLQRNWAFKQEKKGTFLKRRWHNGDDVSGGAIYCD